jgi:hypothetical protein
MAVHRELFRLGSPADPETRRGVAQRLSSMQCSAAPYGAAKHQTRLEPVDRVKPTYWIPIKTESPGAWLVVIVLTVFVTGSAIAWGAISWFSPVWTLIAVLAIIVAVSRLSYAAVKDWGGWHRFHDTAAESTATVVRRIDEKEKDSYGDVTHTYYVVVLVDSDQFRDTELKARVNHTYYSWALEGKTIGVRYLPGDPKVALLEGG